MAESPTTPAQIAASAIIRRSADAVVAEACGSDISDADVDWEATTFSRHKLPDFHKLEERQCAMSMAGYLAERLYLGHPWQEDEGTLRAMSASPASSEKEQEGKPEADASRALLIIRSYHPELDEAGLLAAYRKHERDTQEWLQQIEVWTAVLEKARALGLSEAGRND